MSLEWEMTRHIIQDYLPVRGELILRGTRIVIPRQLRCQVLELAHSGHPGIVAMRQHL